MSRLALLSIVLLAVLCACSRKEPPAQTSANAVTCTEHYLPVDGGRIWYRVCEGGRGTPVILLHGGPGFSSYYLKPFEALADERPVIRYDQLGAGKSDTTSNLALFTIPHFVAELDSLRAHLGYDKVHLLGHSWGTNLAVEYYRAYPEHVASLTLESASLDIPAWTRHANELIATLSDSSQRAIRLHEKDKNFDAPDYQAAIEEFYGKYVWRRPVQADLDSLMKTVNMTLYTYMCGPSEFTLTGTLRNYDATSFLPKIAVPTLYTVGEFDEAGPDNVKRFAQLTPRAEVAVLPGAGHITTWDAPEENVRVVRDFLRRADTRQRR